MHHYFSRILQFYLFGERFLNFDSLRSQAFAMLFEGNTMFQLRSCGLAGRWWISGNVNPLYHPLSNEPWLIYKSGWVPKKSDQFLLKFVAPTGSH